ncbi:MAG: signal recognition particle-docking protein FtsY, partial [Nannocystis sp.]
MPFELIVVLIALGVLVLAGAVVVVVRRSRAALPPAHTPRELPSSAKIRPVVDAPIEGPIDWSRAVQDRDGAVPLPKDKPRSERPGPRSPAEEARQAERRRYELGLARTRGGFVARLAQLFRGKPRVSRELKDEVEEVLFTADIGAKTAQKLLDQVTALLDRSQIADPEQIWAVIRREAREILLRPIPATPPAPFPDPYVLLMIGVNGVGKTTTLGKLAARHQAEGRKVLLVAGDTFRAAAGEQLELWAGRAGCEIVRGAEGSDPAAVVFDALAAARARGSDVVICDTAGRLHTQQHLMNELAKVREVIAKQVPEAPHETLLTIDATTGQNGLRQALLFREVVDVSGIVLTKLDGTAKGGIALAIASELALPVKMIGIGEGIEDLRPFDPHDFASAILGDDSKQSAAMPNASR